MKHEMILIFKNINSVDIKELIDFYNHYCPSFANNGFSYYFFVRTERSSCKNRGVSAKVAMIH